MFASVNLLNLLKFLTLRCHSHAQYEIRVYAEAMRELIRPIVPVCVTSLGGVAEGRSRLRWRATLSSGISDRRGQARDGVSTGPEPVNPLKASTKSLDSLRLSAGPYRATISASKGLRKESSAARPLNPHLARRLAAA